MHGATRLIAVPQAQRVAKLVHALLERPLKQCVPVRFFAIKFGAQTVPRYDGDTALIVGVAEDVPVRRLVQVEIRDRKDEVAGGVLAQHLGRQRGNEQLTACGIKGTSRNFQGRLYGNGKKKPLFQTQPQPKEKCGIDRVDRNDPQARFHPGAVSFDACANTPRMIVGIGMDLAEVARYRFDARKLAWFARKVYTDEEMAYAVRKRNVPERLAGFFAAKEATRKAFGHAIAWRLVGVSHESSGKPVIRLYGWAQDLLTHRGVTAIHLTITHTANIAAAVVILERA